MKLCGFSHRKKQKQKNGIQKDSYIECLSVLTLQKPITILIKNTQKLEICLKEEYGKIDRSKCF